MKDNCIAGITADCTGVLCCRDTISDGIHSIRKAHTMQNIPTSWIICAVLAIMLLTMDYVRRTGPLNDLFRRSDDGGGLFSMLVLVGLIIAAVLLLPQLGLFTDGSLDVSNKVKGAYAGAETVEVSRVVEPEKDDDAPMVDRNDLSGFDHQQLNTQRQQTRTEDLPDHTRTPPSPQQYPSDYPVGVRVKGRPTGSDIVYVIPTSAVGDPTKALNALKGAASRHYAFAIAGKPLVQVGYGPFRNWQEGEDFRKQNGLERSPRAFRISRR